MSRSDRYPATDPESPRVDIPWLTIGTLLLVAAPMCNYVVFAQVCGVNIPWWDEWAFVPILHSALTGHLTLTELWAQHNEDRVLFPNIVELILASFTRYNVTAELLTSAGCQVLTFLGIAAIYVRRRLGPLWGLVPVSALLFSLVQSYNTLSGFALLWFLGLLALTTVAVALEALPKHRWALALAVLGAVVASYSGFQGLLVWLAALPYLVGSRVGWVPRILWIGFAAIAWIVYFVGLGLQPSAIGGSSVYFAAEHPVAALRYLIVLVGSVVPVPFSAATVVIGVAIVVLAAGALGWSFASGAVHRDPALRLPLTLLVYGILFAVATTVGRASFGTLEATSPRYTTTTLVLLLGLYLVLLRWSQSPRPWKPNWGSVLLAACGLVLVGQVGATLQTGWASGLQTRSARMLAADLVVNLARAPSSLVEENVYPYRGPFLPEQVRFLERFRLSIFATSAARADLRLGVVPGGELSPSLPVSGALRALVRGSSSDARAWSVLSTLYSDRPDLQAAFPRGSAHFARDLLTWATTSGVGTDADSVFLRPFRSELDRLLRGA